MSGGAEIRESARAGGLQPGDPLAPLIETLAVHADRLDAAHDALVAAGIETAGGLRVVLREGRETANAEAARFRAECRAAEADTVASLSTALADTSAQAFAGRVRAIDRRTAVLVALSVVGALVLGASAGWWSGVATTRAAIAETEAGLRAAFREGPDAARLWLDLMSWNDPREALVRCRDRGEIREENGRRTCRLVMWVARPPALPAAAAP